VDRRWKFCGTRRRRRVRREIQPGESALGETRDENPRRRRKRNLRQREATALALRSRHCKSRPSRM
jgi:hypothetical protein